MIAPQRCEIKSCTRNMIDGICEITLDYDTNDDFHTPVEKCTHRKFKLRSKD